MVRYFAVYRLRTVPSQNAGNHAEQSRQTLILSEVVSNKRNEYTQQKRHEKPDRRLLHATRLVAHKAR